MSRVSLWALCFVLMGADGVFGCGNCDKENAQALQIESGLVDPSGNSYQSNLWSESYVHFPAGRRLALVHHLRAVPEIVKTYVAFVEQPLPDGKNGNTSEAAGNEVIVERVDCNVIQIRNDTCESDFYVRVVAEVGSNPGADTLCTDQTPGAGGSAGAAGEGVTSGVGGTG